MSIQQTLPVPRMPRTVRALLARVIEGPDAGTRHLSTTDVVTVGTAPNNDLVLADETVSRYHIELSRSDDGIRVIDHGSTNGTLVNGVRIQSAIVAPGARVHVGRTTIEVTNGAEVAVETHDSEALAGLRGRTPVMRKLMGTIAKVAESEVSVLVHGETGSGKEVVATALHELGARRDQPLEIVDCGSMLPTLVASELFGHERGAFTGADQRHIGAFERADGGTIFLDEIGELPPSLQSALLGVLERRRFTRVGGTEPITVDVRVVAATNRDLRREVNDGTFRQDLYFRLAVVTLSIPPLRERRDDIPLLAEHFLRRAGHGDQIEAILTPRVIESFRAHYWPGNVRELRNIIDATIAIGEAPELGGAREPAKATPVVAASDPLRFDELAVLPYNNARTECLDRFELAYLSALLERHGGNVSAAARGANMNRSYVTKLLRRHGLRGQSDHDD